MTERSSQYSKSNKDKILEFSQTIDKYTVIVALGGAALGIIPIGFALAAIGLSAATYLGAELIKNTGKAPNKSPKLIYQAA